MSSIVLLDTSVFLNVLDIPAFNQDRDNILGEFEERTNNEDHFLLPMAAIWETRNHIAHLSSGGLRSQYAEKFVDAVVSAFEGKAPYRPTHFPDRAQLLDWIRAFPDYANRNKSPRKEREGVSLSDLSIIKEWEITKRRHNMSRVLIWSLDEDLKGYDTQV